LWFFPLSLCWELAFSVSIVLEGRRPLGQLDPLVKIKKLKEEEEEEDGQLVVGDRSIVTGVQKKLWRLATARQEI
jgi:hypothetical protein